MARLLLLPLCAFASVATASTLCVSSVDSSLEVCLDGATGTVVSLLSGGLAIAANASTSLASARTLGAATVARAADGSIVVTREWAFAAPAPTNTGAVVTDTFMPRATSVGWRVSVVGTGAPAWSVPINTALAVDADSFSRLKLWAPWDRDSASTFPKGSWVDPLAPSDARPSGWWTGGYRLGSARDTDFDFIVAPLASLLSANPDAVDAGVSLVLSPTDAPLDVWMRTDEAAREVRFERSHARIDTSTPPVVLNADLVGHAGDLRAALAWAVADAAVFYKPVNEEVFAAAGLGGYSWFGGDLSPYADALHSSQFKVNWDLSGRFFPYMGMFLPPVAESEVWLNDPEGTQPRANITFASIGEQYRAMEAQGFVDLSYFNCNEYGINVVLPPSAETEIPKNPRRRLPPPPVDWAAALARARAGPGGGATCASTWKNASACIADGLLGAVVSRAYDWASGSIHSHGAIYSWQNSIVIDNGDAAYHAFLVEQLLRHIIYEDAFAGIVIDRSDWMDLYNLDVDDGLSFLPEVALAKNVSGAAASCKRAYARMAEDLRAALTVGHAAAVSAPSGGVTPLGSGLMLQNLVGNARVDMFRYFDGIFSEGNLVNGIGILGIASPAIMWLYTASECCATPAATASYFQTHLYMGVMPMAPYPGNDHAIAWDPRVSALFARYGTLFGAVAPRVWCLAPHLAAPAAGSGAAAPKVNAFVSLVDASAAAPEQVLLVPVMLGGDGPAALNLTRFDRAWGEEHPLVLTRRLARDATPAAAPTSFSFDVAVPGVTGFVPLAGAPATLTCGSAPAPPCTLLLTVPLVEGAALVRVRGVPGAASAAVHGGAE